MSHFTGIHVVLYVVERLKHALFQVMLRLQRPRHVLIFIGTSLSQESMQAFLAVVWSCLRQRRFRFWRILTRFSIAEDATDMGNRLSKIATRTGDDGTTGLGDGRRTGKDSARVHALGDVDELNSQIGLLLCEDLPEPVSEQLISIQHDLFDLGGELSIPGYTALTEDHVVRLDALLQRYNADLPPLKEFILPGGSRAAAIAHICRTVCRRAERTIVHLGSHEPVNEHARQYLNRLSDLLFVWARVLNRFAGGSDVLWKKGRKPGE